MVTPAVVANATTTTALADSLPTIINSARLVNEYEGVMSQLVDRQMLGKGEGLNWNEISLPKLTAQNITEGTLLSNAQQITDTLLQFQPTMIGILVVILDRTRNRISQNVMSKTGALAENAMIRKEDTDGLSILDSATTSLPGAGSTLVSGHINAAVARINGNTTEPGTSQGPKRFVCHSFQCKDIEDEIRGGVGTVELTDGMTANVFRDGSYRGMVGGAQTFTDDNITIDGSSDAKGGVFAQNAIVLVNEFENRAVTVRNEALGGGADMMYMYKSYIFGIRLQAWIYEIYSDATTPTS